MAFFQPHPLLRDRVCSIEVVDVAAATVAVLPGTAIVLGFQFRGRVRGEQGLLSIAGVTGLQQAVRRYDYLDAAASILVRFTPQGAACLGVSPAELSGRSVPLDEVLRPARAREASQRLVDATDSRARVDVVERLLMDLPYVQDSVVAYALRLIETIPNDLAEGPLVRRVAQTLRISERQLERRFLAGVGITPKRFSALRRFERVVATAGGARRLTDVGVDAGYYDQSHFIREFRRFAGESPGSFFRRHR